MGRNVVWLGVYVGLVAWLTWPLAAHLTTHLPRTIGLCDFDQRQMIWALAYTSHRLVTAPWSLFEANVHHPTPHALLYAESGLGAVPFFFPTYVATGDVTLAANVMFLGSLALTAWGVHLLAVRWTGLAGAGVVAACTFLMTPWTLWTWAPGPMNYAVLPWVPLIVGLAASTTSSRPILLGLVLAAQGATSPYVAAAVLAPVGVLALGRLGRRTHRPSGVALAQALAIAVALLALVYGGYAWVRFQNPSMQASTWWPGAFNRFEFPRDLFLARHRPNAIPLAVFVLIGAGALCAAWRGARTPLAWRHGALWTAVGVLVSLPEIFVWFGTEVTLPHVALARSTPLLDLMREPQRMAVGALFGLAVLAAAAYGEVVAAVERIPRARPALAQVGVTGCVVLAAYFTYTHVAWPPSWFGVRLLPPAYPLAAASLPGAAMLAELGRRPGVLLALPATGSRRETVIANAQAMFESTAHWHPLVNGYGGYYPAGFGETLAIVARLPDSAAVAALRERTGVDLIMVRGETMQSKQRDAFESLARQGGGRGLRLLLREGPDLLFAVDGGV